MACCRDRVRRVAMEGRRVHDPDLKSGASFARHVCAATGVSLPSSKVVLLRSVRPEIMQLIRQRYPDLPEEAWISNDVLNAARIDYLLHQQATRLIEIEEIQLAVRRELAQARQSRGH